MKINYKRTPANTLKNGCISIGNISTSRLYVSVEWHPYLREIKPIVSFGKTYDGTKRGAVIIFGGFSLIAHEREQEKEMGK